MNTLVDAQSRPIISVKCEEPEGDVIRHVYPLRFTPDNLQRFYEKAKNFRVLFTDEVNGDFQRFAELFMSLDDDKLYARGLTWVVDDFVGVFYMTHIELHDAKVHYTFFDRRHIGREKLTQEMLKYVFDRYQFRRLTTEIPLYASKHTFNFVFRLGFKKEGRIRKARQYKGEWFDVMTLGILRDEVEAWA